MMEQPGGIRWTEARADPGGLRLGDTVIGRFREAGVRDPFQGAGGLAPDRIARAEVLAQMSLGRILETPTVARFRGKPPRWAKAAGRVPPREFFARLSV